MEFIELPSFTAAVKEANAEESLRGLQLELITDPMKGDVIRGTGGFRKVRMRLPGRGKSGSLRAIYLYFLDRNRIYLAMLYRKNVRDTLSHDQKAALRRIATSLKVEP
jgi:hypothetical protein